ncbi:hypothetical protein [Methanosarcina sp. MTP4]|uniref:hypothetical protein n=1 Tax=Methanosarcina sp. MTP4 TaxID=1434100 RepID=UPI00064F6579|nr:hypothetical protein [Methanosarcina sp. MTP4]
MSATVESILDIDPEIMERMPKTFRLYFEIERRAQEKYQQILADVAAGKTTLEEERRKRGIL